MDKDKTVIIGSTALQYHLKDMCWREPKDFDTMTQNNLPNGMLKNEDSFEEQFSIISMWNQVVNYLSDKSINGYADINSLYTIKVSHAAWNIHWQKTMLDIVRLRDYDKNLRIDYVLYDALYILWEKLHGEKKVNLKEHNDYFFKKAVTRKYNHDWLHEQVAFYDRPLNEKIRKDLDYPFCDIGLFNELSYQDKIILSLEEIIVIAIERYNLQLYQSNIEYKRAINNAYKSLVTTMTTGFFNRFLIENMKPLIYDGEKLWKSQLLQSLKKIQINA